MRLPEFSQKPITLSRAFDGGGARDGGTTTNKPQTQKEITMRTLSHLAILITTCSLLTTSAVGAQFTESLKPSCQKRMMLDELVRGTLENWPASDNGIWELGGGRQYTFGCSNR
jgi:hypothetical protein